MKRLNDNVLHIIDKEIRLSGKKILEIGCGNGAKSQLLSEKCRELVAIDPDAAAIEFAKQNYASTNCTYLVGSAEDLAFTESSFDAVIFSLSLHHVPINKMDQAIAEAVRVIKKKGRVVFVEPTFVGTFFEAEIQFWASDGDERKEKAAAYYHMLNSQLLHEELETFDTVTFEFESVDDFKDSMEPSKNVEHLPEFLEKHKYTVQAQRRINIFSVA